MSTVSTSSTDICDKVIKVARRLWPWLASKYVLAWRRLQNSTNIMYSSQTWKWKNINSWWLLMNVGQSTTVCKCSSTSLNWPSEARGWDNYIYRNDFLGHVENWKLYMFCRATRTNDLLIMYDLLVISWMFLLFPECSFYIVLSSFNTLRPRQNGRHFADDIFKCIFLKENVRISINISLDFVPYGAIDYHHCQHWFR